MFVRNFCVVFCISYISCTVEGLDCYQCQDGCESSPDNVTCDTNSTMCLWGLWKDPDSKMKEKRGCVNDSFTQRCDHINAYEATDGAFCYMCNKDLCNGGSDNYPDRLRCFFCEDSCKELRGPVICTSDKDVCVSAAWKENGIMKQRRSCAKRGFCEEIKSKGGLCNECNTEYCNWFSPQPRRYRAQHELTCYVCWDNCKLVLKQVCDFSSPVCISAKFKDGKKMIQYKNCDANNSDICRYFENNRSGVCRTCSTNLCNNEGIPPPAGARMVRPCSKWYIVAWSIVVSLIKIF